MSSMLLSEYCCPLWTRSSYTSLIDTQLHSSMRLISGCLHSTPVSWLLILSNVSSPSLCSKAASDKMLQIIEVHPNWPVYADMFYHQSSKWQDASDHWSPPKLTCLCWYVLPSTSLAYLPTPNLVRHDTCWHNCAVERRLAIGFCGRLYHCNEPKITAYIACKPP